MIRSLSVVIPAFNEESRLPGTLRNVTEYLRTLPLQFAEVLVVDDGSVDRTAALAEQFSAECPVVRVLRNGQNRGKGYSVRHGMLQARGDWRLFSDADLSTPVQELAKLACASDCAGVDIAIGSRALDRSLIVVHQPAFRETAGKLFNVAMRIAVGLPLHDTQCGFKLFSKRAAETVFPRQRLEGFGFDVEVLLIARINGFGIKEVPVAWSHSEGTRVSALSGARSFLDLFLIRRNQLAGRYRG